MKTLKYLPILLFLTCTAWAGEKVSDEIAYKIIEKVNQDAIANMKKEFKPINKINNFKMVIDTTWQFYGCLVGNCDCGNRIIKSIDTTWVEDTWVLRDSTWKQRFHEDSLEYAPLKFKVDTVSMKIDTTGFERVEEKKHDDNTETWWMCNSEVLTSLPVQYKPCSLPEHMITLSIWKPICDTTVVTKKWYDLTPEQIRKLEGR